MSQSAESDIESHTIIRLLTIQLFVMHTTYLPPTYTGQLRSVIFSLEKCLGR